MIFIKLKKIAKKINAKLYGNENLIINSIAPLNLAKKGQITFLSNKKYIKQLKYCKATAIILKKKHFKKIKIATLVVQNPYLAYAKLAKILDTTPKPANKIHPYSIIEKNVKIGKKVGIGANTVIEKGVNLGNKVSIGSGCFIGKNVIINDYSKIWSNVSIYHDTEIGKNCLIQAGSVIGSDGFGYAQENKKWKKIPQLGKVIIKNNVEIGACTTIDRGSIENTIIGNGVIIDNQCQIAHNVIIGDNTAIAGGVILGGSLILGKNCMIGGASVINGHIKICNKVNITGMSMIIRSIKKPGIYSSGMPIQENKKWRKTTVLIMNINKIYRKIRELERKILNKKN